VAALNETQDIDKYIMQCSKIIIYPKFIHFAIVLTIILKKIRLFDNTGSPFFDNQTRAWYD